MLALPPNRRLKHGADFDPERPSVQVERGWLPVVEAQPEIDGLLAGPVAGQQVWKFDPTAAAGGEQVKFDPVANPNASDEIFRAARLVAWTYNHKEGLEPSKIPSALSMVMANDKLVSSSTSTAEALAAAAKGFDFYRRLQCDDGQWAGDYGGPHFLLPGLIISSYISGGLTNVLAEPYWKAAEAYVRNHQQADGGWGTHVESPSTMFGSVLMYVSLRLLGADAEDPACVKGRAFLAAHGGALKAPSWAKFWLTVLGVHEYSGLAPLSPEMWLLPYWFPLHPGRFWCHCRMVYLPMCYLYARRFQNDATQDSTLMALRQELYEGLNYEAIQWPDHIYDIDEADSYCPIHWSMRWLQHILEIYERLGPCGWLRQMSIRFVEEYIHSEDVQSNYLTIGPVSKSLHLLCAWVRGGTTEEERMKYKEFRAHCARAPAYLWIAEDGLKMQGYNGSMIWDTSFALQALTEAQMQRYFPAMAAKAWAFLVREQVQVLPRGDWRHFRQAICGGWGFSTAEQSWPVSDTTGEAFLAVLGLRTDPCVADVPSPSDAKLFNTVSFLLSYQNGDGGWSTYENSRGWPWYEKLNPAETFGDIMIDYSYVECSASAMKSLVSFARQFPNHREREIARAVQRGVRYIESMQRPDGSWYGSWGCCFTYGCLFGIEGLLCGGRVPTESVHIQRCVQFLLQHQNEDGGWGEDFASCYDGVYGSRPKLSGSSSGSGVVNTAWALLALMAAECEDLAAVRKGVDFLMQRQQQNGDWLQENLIGVFNRSIGITYTAFRNVFPLWALARYARVYGPAHGLPCPADC